ncbi:hypothetical protein [Brevibacterium gallinarum]|uniref:Uncharacterized protein n=1 Tax=Brevibacterium gallinarum TaxID=2762220 RepID=A0ABR8WWI2_9MICO|nr:hypothetical protein [Brevibacterium gallinarum]MBD8021292.1 hypothetical protein [Brevibacterium gallinarum]
MYSRPPHRDIPRDLYGLPATPPDTRTPSPAPDRSNMSFSPAAGLRRSRGAGPVVIVISVVIAVALLSSLAAAVLSGGV